MFYTNALTLTMENNEKAAAALEVLVKRLEAGFEIDKTYRRTPSKEMAGDLMVEENTIVFSDEWGYYTPEDSNEIFVELLKELAAVLKVNFSCITYNNGDYSESGIKAIYENGLLKVEEAYTSFCDFECDEEENWEDKPTITTKEFIIK